MKTNVATQPLTLKSDVFPSLQLIFNNKSLYPDGPLNVAHQWYRLEFFNVPKMNANHMDGSEILPDHHNVNTFQRPSPANIIVKKL